MHFILLFLCNKMIWRWLNENWIVLHCHNVLWNVLIHILSASFRFSAFFGVKIYIFVHFNCIQMTWDFLGNRRWLCANFFNSKYTSGIRCVGGHWPVNGINATNFNIHLSPWSVNNANSRDPKIANSGFRTKTQKMKPMSLS